MKKIFLKLFYSFFAIIIFAVSICYLLLGTDAGFKITVHYAQKFIPGYLIIDKIDGNFLSYFKIQQLHYANHSTSVDIQSLEMNWRIKNILHPKIYIDSINADHVLIKYNPINQKSTSSIKWNTLLKPLSYIKINHANIKNVSYFMSNKLAFQFDLFSLTQNLNGSHQLFLDSTFGKITGSYQFTPDLQWNLFLNGESVNFKFISPQLESKINFSLTSSGEWNNNESSISLNLYKLNGLIRQYPLQASVMGSYKNGNIDLSHANLKFSNANINVVGQFSQISNLNWSLTIPNLSQLFPSYSGTLSSQGSLTGDRRNVKISGVFKGQQINADGIKIKNISGSIYSSTSKPIVSHTEIIINQIEYNKLSLPRVNLEMLSRFDEPTLSNQIKIFLNPSNSINGILTLPDLKQWTDFTQKIDGAFKVNFLNLAYFTQFVPKHTYVQSANGQLTGNIDVSGTLNDPLINTNLMLSKGGFSIPRLNTQVKNLNLKLTSRPTQPINVDGSFQMGGGNGKVSGSINNNLDDFSVDLNGSNLQFANTDEYKMKASPDLQLNYQNKNISVKGFILIPYANITPIDFRRALTLPSEVVIVNEPLPEQALPSQLTLSVKIQLKDHIYLKYENLQAQLQGSLFITQNPGSPITASGELNTVSGTYQAYGRKLIIQNGRLIYAGNLLSNPGLDIRAIQRVKTIAFAGSSQLNTDALQPVYAGSDTQVVGIQVRGTLKNPVISFFSDPPGLSQGDILSYLVLGYPQSQVSGTSSLALLNMVPGVSDQSNVGDMTSKLQQQFGLTDFSVGSTEYYNTTSNVAASTTTVNIGKDLGHNLSLHYSVGLFDPVSIFSLRYQLSKYFIIQTETSELESGGDILYQSESKQ